MHGADVTDVAAAAAAVAVFTVRLCFISDTAPPHTKSLADVV